jgi:cytochrome c oxidase subunit 1
MRSLKSGEIAGDNPWNGSTFEWATTSPPPSYNFEKPPVFESENLDKHTNQEE